MLNSIGSSTASVPSSLTINSSSDVSSAASSLLPFSGFAPGKGLKKSSATSIFPSEIVSSSSSEDDDSETACPRFLPVH